MVWQGLAETAEAHGPVAGGGEGFFEFGAELVFGDVAFPSLSAGAALVAEAAEVVAFVVADVAVAGDVDAVGTASVVVAVVAAFPTAAGSGAEVVVHEVVAEFAGVVSESVGEALGFGVHEEGGGGEGAGADEDDLGVVFAVFHGDGVADVDAGGALGILIVDDFADDGVGPKGEASGGDGGGEGGCLGAEVGAEGAASDAAVAVLAGPASDGGVGVFCLGEVGDAADGHVAAGKLFFDAFADFFFEVVHLHGWEKFAIGKLGQAEGFSGDAGEFFYVGVPGGDVFVTDGPVDGDAFFGVGFEVDVGEAVALASPHDGFAAYDVGAVPVEAFVFFVEGVVVFEPVFFGPLVVGVVAGEFGVGLGLLGGDFAVVFGLPGGLHGGLVAGDVGEVFAALEHEDSESFFGEFFGGPAAGDAGADDDGVVGVLGGRANVYVCHWGRS